ncbi:hypothetical protein [Intrasporangium mesophilum]
MTLPGRGTATAVVVGFGVTAVATAVQLWPSLGRGQLLYRDFVSVPSPVLNARALGLDGYAPRAVPLDAVTALLSAVVPSGVQQQVMLLATLLLAGTGVTWLLRGHGPVATGVAAAAATWSVYGTERLLLGQPPTLLAWSVLPWVVVAARRPATGWRWLSGVAVVSLPAALTPFGGVAVLAAGLCASCLYGRSSRDLALLAGLGLVWCLPWLVPALLGATEAGEDGGVSAFRVEARGIGGLLDVVTGGGAWSAAARLPSRGEPVALAASAALIALAVLGWRGLRSRRRAGFAAAALIAPPVVALALATPAGVALFSRLQWVPGLGLFRDTHRLLLASSMTLCVLAGLGAARMAALLAGPRTRSTADAPEPTSRSGSAAPPGSVSAAIATRLAVGVTGVGLVLLAAPDASARLAAAYRPTTMPQAWADMVAAVGEGRALLLPWQPMRQVSWAGPEPFLDPVPLAVPRTTAAARRLTVVRDGQVWVVGPSEPPQAAAWARGDALDADALRRDGIDRVVEWLGTPGPLPKEHRGLRQLLATREFTVWSVP